MLTHGISRAVPILPLLCLVTLTRPVPRQFGAPRPIARVLTLSFLILSPRKSALIGRMWKWVEEHVLSENPFFKPDLDIIPNVFEQGAHIVQPSAVHPANRRPANPSTLLIPPSPASCIGT
ncbi:hypothetical protein FRB95_006748 [Tulasnella sp. JGI-2019a]|nr:hypothetical protein FRB93_000435 [Tulasnella sp. JGI-2019a]KAG9028213.1 hypothetical protein FRB95_006748 [Tulasnella sp. JGI-2019a]